MCTRVVIVQTAAMCESGSLCLMKFVLILTLIITGLTPTGFGAKILFIPPNVESLVYSYSRLAADLTLLGHVTHVLAPSNARLPQFIAQFQHPGNFSYTRYTVDGDQPFSNRRNVSEFLLRIAISRSPWERFFLRNELDKDFLHHCECDCIRLVENDRLMQRIRSEGYQFAVMPPVVPECFYAIPYSLGIPYGTMSAPGLAWLYRVPRLPSFSPLFRFGFTDRMSFGQRLTSFVGGSLLTLYSTKKATKYCDRLAPDRTSLSADQLMQQVLQV